MRQFYKISLIEYDNYKNLLNYSDIFLPTRQTRKSCGYDFICPYEIVVKAKSVVKIYTGIKCEMEDDEFLLLAVRSSVGIKKGLVLANQVGIIDADYYNNPDNEGHIIIAIRNMLDEDVVINKGERIAQGIILKYNIVNEDIPVKEERTGGFGSTGR